MNKFLLLCLNIALVTPIVAARPVLTKAKWQEMKKGDLKEEIILPETRPMLIEDVEDIEEIDQTPPPLPPRPTQITPPPLPPRPVTPPPLPPRPTTTGTKSGLPFTDQDLATQAGKLKTPTIVHQGDKEPVKTFEQQLKDKFKGASGSEDEGEEEDWEWED